MIKHAIFLFFVFVSLLGTITELADTWRFTKLRVSYPTMGLAFFASVLIMTLGCWYGVL